MPFDDAAVGVLRRVVGDQEYAAVEEGAAGGGTAADVGRRVGGMAELRACLRIVIGAPGHVLPGGFGRQGERCRHEAAAAFLGVQPAGAVDDLPQLRERRGQRGRDQVGVEPGDHVVAGVVYRTDEPAVVGNRDAAVGEDGAHLGAVGHRRDQPRVGAGKMAGAGAAVVGRGVRVVLAVRAVAGDDDQRRKAVGQPGAAQQRLHAVGLLDVGEAELARRGRGRRAVVGRDEGDAGGRAHVRRRAAASR